MRVRFAAGRAIIRSPTEVLVSLSDSSRYGQSAYVQLVDSFAFRFEEIASEADDFGTLIGRDFRVRKARATSRHILSCKRRRELLSSAD